MCGWGVRPKSDPWEGANAENAGCVYEEALRAERRKFDFERAKMREEFRADIQLLLKQEKLESEKKYSVHQNRVRLLGEFLAGIRRETAELLMVTEGPSSRRPSGVGTREDALTKRVMDMAKRNQEILKTLEQEL